MQLRADMFSTIISISTNISVADLRGGRGRGRGKEHYAPIKTIPFFGTFLAEKMPLKIISRPTTVSTDCFYKYMERGIRFYLKSHDRMGGNR